MTDPDYVNDLRECLRKSPHLWTLIGLMEQNGVDIASAMGETPHGIPLAIILAQGWTAEKVAEAGRAIERAVADLRDARRREAEQG